MKLFAPITVEELDLQIKIVEKDDFDLLINHLRNDLISFNTENFSVSSEDFGPEGLVGFHTEENGLTYCGMCAGGDWEKPVFFCVYSDGLRLRAYVPTSGNLWNTDTQEAYGNNCHLDFKNAKERFPELFDKLQKRFLGIFENPDLLEDDWITFKSYMTFDSQLIRQELIEQMKIWHPEKQIKVNDSIQSRIESLTYFYEEDAMIDVFNHACSLTYCLFQNGMTEQAEVACSVAENIAHGSFNLHLKSGIDLRQTKGFWAK